MFHIVHVFGGLLILSSLNVALHSEEATESELSTFSSEKLDTAFHDRAKTVPKHLIPSSELQANSLDKTVIRKKKDKELEQDISPEKAEEEENEVEGLPPDMREEVHRVADEDMREHELDSGEKFADKHVETILERYSDRDLAPSATKEGGQILRGTMNFYGIIFAVGMNRAHFKKTLHDNWFYRKKNKTDSNASWFGKRKYYEAVGEMYFKLLRYPAVSEDGRMMYRKRVAKKWKAINNSDTILLTNLQQEGWTGKIKIKGWWNDKLMHFRGAVKEKDVFKCDALSGMNVNDLSLLHWAGLPWTDVDIRFDDEGAHCRADFPVEKKGFFNRMFGGEKHTYIMWRMDALDPQEVESRVFQGTVALPYWHGGNTFSTRLRLDSCVQGENMADTFTCVLDMRPIVLFNLGQTEDLNNAKSDVAGAYASPPAGSLGGPWFTYIGMHGKLFMKFEPDGQGNYEGRAMGSECGMEDPCPFLMRHFLDVKVVMLRQAVLMRPEGETDPDIPDRVPDAIYLFPIYDDSFMREPQVDNYQELPLHRGSISPLLPDDRPVVKFKEDDFQNERLLKSKERDRKIAKMYDQEFFQLKTKIKLCGIENFVQSQRGKVTADFQAKLDKFQDDLDAIRQEILELAKSLDT